MKDWEKEIRRIIVWIKKRVIEAGATGLVLGMSGGVDSSVAAILAQKACPDSILGLILPCHSLLQDQRDAELVARQFSISYLIVSLDTVFDSFLSLFGESYRKPLPLPIANLIPRLRMTVLYYYAQKMNYLVCGSSNKSELTIGYFTKYGDGGVDLMPLAHLTKTEIWELAQALGVPDAIIQKTPSAGLWEDQTDEGEMGITYRLIDQFITSGMIEEPSLSRIKNMIARSEHKRHLPPQLE
jgi:NAD+ synthase